MYYDYLEAMKEDIIEHLHESFTQEEIIEHLENREEWENELYDDLWCNDYVTGNASGSYTFNSWKAKEYVMDNGSLLREALEEFCVESDTIAEKFLDEEWEYFDVIIRCYLLGQAIDEALDGIEKEMES